MKLRAAVLPGVFVFLALCLSCKSPAPAAVEAEPAPAVLPAPRASLTFDRIEAEDLERITLWFNLEAENLRPESVRFVSAAWHAVFNGEPGAAAKNFTALEGALPPGEKSVFPARLDIAPEALLENSAGAGTDCEAELSLDLVFDYGEGKTETVPVKAAAVFPLIRKPEFRIMSVAVRKAELIDTRFKVKIRLKNPNIFPVELSAFSFELYNGGRLWAGGKRRNILSIPQGQTAETEFFLTMNFIGMHRNLLDQVIAMEQIYYRFAGEATVST
jgi:LEA14-like dessication related protein